MKISSYIKRGIHSLIRIFGYELKGKRKIVKHNDFDAIIKFLLKEKDKDKESQIFFDVGANLGQSINRLKRINSKSQIHSFEPAPDLFKSLKNQFEDDKSITLNNLGVANTDGEINFHTYKYHGINSAISIDKKSKFLKSRVLASKAEEDNFEKIIKINVTSIDHYCEKKLIKEIDYIKIDTQGYETKILEGMENILEKNNVSIIELELILGFGYERSFSFYDYEKILSKKNYKLIAIDTASNIISFSNYQTNLLYVKNEIFEKIRLIHEKNIDIRDVTNKTDISNPFSY